MVSELHEAVVHEPGLTTLADAVASVTPKETPKRVVLTPPVCGPFCLHAYDRAGAAKKSR
jgi:hypothetical protein